MSTKSTMTGLWVDGGKICLRHDLPRPRPGAEEALVRVRLCGICGTDLALMRGYLDYTGVPGHELVGEVVECREPGWQGTRVVAEINAACHACPTCLQRGMPEHCPTRTVVGIQGRPGALAEYLVVPQRSLHAVPSDVSDQAAAFCEPLAAALQIQQQVAVRPLDDVLVVGAGRLGQLIARTLALTGCRLQVVTRHTEHTESLRRIGIATIAAEQVQSASADVVVDASGSPTGFALAVEATRPRGTIVLKSTCAEPLAVDTGKVVVNELCVVASRCGPFAAALRLLHLGVVDPLPLVEGTLPLSEGERAFAQAARPGALKLLLQP